MAAAIEVRERDVRRSEELFRQFAENLPEVVWVEDAASGRIEYVGPAFARIGGRTRMPCAPAIYAGSIASSRRTAANLLAG